MRVSTRQLVGFLVFLGILAPSLARGAVQARFSVPDPFHPARTLVLFEALAALTLFTWLAWQRRREIDRRALLIGCAVTGLALVLRLAGSQWAWFHENRHGYRYIVGIVDGRPGYMPPSTYYVLMNFATWLGPPRDATLLLLNALFSTATVPLVGLVAAQISRRRVAGWAAMGLWALSPYAIRLAATATYFNIGLFFLTAGLAASIHALRRLDDDHLPVTGLVLAVLCTALAAQTRATTIFWPGTVLLVAFSVGDVKTRQRWIALVGLAVAIAFLLIPKLSLFLGSEEAGGRYFMAYGFIDNLKRLTVLDRSVVSPLVAPLALIGGLLLIRGHRRLGVVPTLALSALAAFPGAVWLRALFTVRRCDGFICVSTNVPHVLAEAAPMLAGAGLAVFLTWFFARSLRVDIPWLPDSRRGGVAVLGVVLPLFTSAMITGLHVARLRFDLVPTALVTILAGLGVAGVVSLVFHRRIIASVVFTALIASALIPLPHLWRPYADPMEHHFLLNEVVPVLATQDPRPRLVFPKEAEKSKSVPTEWWDSYLPAVQVVPDLSDLEDADDARALYAVIGYTCSWSHGRWEGDRWLDEEGVSWASPPPYPQAEHIEGEPRIHPRCAAALAGHRWRTIATRKIPLFGMEGNNTRVHPGLEEVTIGLYQADSAGESIHTP